MLKNVQRMDVSPSYINSVVLNGTGERAMMLASKVACDFYSNDTIEYISNSPSLASDTNVCSSSEHTFCDELKSFFDKKGHLFSKLEEPFEKNTRATPFTIIDAKTACESYISGLWRAVADRVKYTDLSECSCCYTEAPAEGIFSIYDRIISGREKLSIDNAVALTRVSIHGPPPATKDSEAI